MDDEISELHPQPAIAAARLSRFHHWRAALRELVIIVAGVLGALAGQAWWEARRDGIREQEYLRQLLVDTRENERRVDLALRDDRVTQAALRRLARALYTGTPTSNRDSALALLTAPVFSSSNFEPLTGTYGALISSGDLRLIRTDSLRAAIVAYGSQLEYEQRMLAFYLQQAFGQPASLVRGLPFMRAMFVAPDSIGPIFRRSGVGLAQLRDNSDFAGFLFALEAANGNRIAHLAMIHDATDHLRGMLEAETHERDATSDSTPVAHGN